MDDILLPKKEKRKKGKKCGALLATLSATEKQDPRKRRCPIGPISKGSNPHADSSIESTDFDIESADFGIESTDFGIESAISSGRIGRL